MTWLQWIVQHPIAGLIGLVASLVALYPLVRWLLGFRITRVDGRKRDCRYCDGTGKVFNGTQVGRTRVGNTFPCQICKGLGVVDE